MNRHRQTEIHRDPRRHTETNTDANIDTQTKTPTHVHTHTHMRPGSRCRGDLSKARLAKSAQIS